MKKKSFENEIIDEINSSDLNNLTIDLADIGLNSFVDDGIIKELPIIGLISNFYKITKNIKQVIFIKKLLVFLQKTNKVDPKLKQKFIDDLNKNVNKKRQTGETIIMLLERSDSIEKVEIIANLFIAFLENNITYKSFKRISRMLNNTELTDLLDLYKHSKSNRLSDIPYEILDNLAYSGFVSMGIIELDNEFTNKKHKPNLYLIPNKQAITLLKFGFNKK